jgi:hypothetical protein
MGKVASTWRSKSSSVNSIKIYFMPVNFKIQVTKEIIAQCKEVGVLDDVDIIGNKCPIAVAMKGIFPEVHVSNLYFYPFGRDVERKIDLPQIAQNFINLFDSLCTIAKTRLLIPAFEFEIEIPDEVIESISIEKDLVDCTTNNTKMPNTKNLIFNK